MADLFDYLFWRGDLTMDQLPFNAVDGLILSWFASLKLSEPLPQTVGGAAVEAEGGGQRFARALAGSLRFRNMQLYRFSQNFSPEEETQFAAVTVLTGDGSAFIAFRGTDSTLVGWKEDFNMAYMSEVPAQRSAVDYINLVGGELDVPLRVGGHSKGGNLAVYGAAMCALSVQERIETVYNFDGPGLSMQAAQSSGYRRAEARIETFLPEASIVGILLERPQRYHVVKADAEGAMQHSPYTWQVEPNGFVLLDGLAQQSLYADRTIRSWLGSMSMADRKTFVDALYEVLEASGVQTLDEIDWDASGRQMLEALGALDLRTKSVLVMSLGRLVRSAVKNINAKGEES